MIRKKGRRPRPGAPAQCNEPWAALAGSTGAGVKSWIDDRQLSHGGRHRLSMAEPGRTIPGRREHRARKEKNVGRLLDSDLAVWSPGGGRSGLARLRNPARARSRAWLRKRATLRSSAKEGIAVVGDWMGSQYDVGGRRYDYRLFLDHDGRYERTVRREPDYVRKDTGRWFHDEAEGVLRLESDTPEDADRMSSSWWVLSVRTCEDSSCILVLRWVALASRNLPVLFYRVHCNRRGYGTGWEQRLADQHAAADSAHDSGSS
jgi:hypothetical protein